MPTSRSQKAGSAPTRRKGRSAKKPVAAKKSRRKAATRKRSSEGRRKAGGGSTADELATKQRDISVSEFFAKNRHLLGFDNPSKALLTTVKEGVDNALDACEEAHIVPDIRVEIERLDETRFRIAIQDNGPGS